jgi:hypothetical protein
MAADQGGADPALRLQPGEIALTDVERITI